MGQQIVTGNKLTLINFYREQLQKFNKLGVGSKTETKTLVTDRLIKVTRKRLDELSSVYEMNLSEGAFRQRKKRIDLLAWKEKLETQTSM